jgi:hypothetical protein
MEEPTLTADLIPLDGWPLSMAVRRLLPETHMKVLGAALAAYEGKQDAAAIRHYRQFLWRFLVARIVRREVIVKGFAPAALAGGRTVIDPTWAQDAAPNFDENSLTLGDLTYSGVRFSPADSVTTPIAKKSSRFDYRTEDAPLIAEMKRLLETGAARGVMNAAQAVSARAVGKGSDESKVKRLVNGYNAL